MAQIGTAVSYTHLPLPEDERQREDELEVVITHDRLMDFLTSREAVSYTHLDVYKRQGIWWIYRDTDMPPGARNR